MNILMFVYLAILAFVLSPGVLLRLPPGAGPTTVAATHALVLSLVYGLTHVIVFRSMK
jgi:MoxR-like ATPase